MDSFCTMEELEHIGFVSLGSGVKLSRRASIYFPERISIGNHVRIDDFCILSGRIKIGDYVHIAAYTAIYGGEDGVFIENFANISSRVSTYSVNDDYSGLGMTNPMIPEKFRRVESASVKIGRHVIVGSTSVILPGVTLPEGSAFGSFSFINHDAEPWSLNTGIPFKRIRERNRDVLELEKQFRNEKS